MQLKVNKWGDIRWVGGCGRTRTGYALICEGSTTRMLYTSKTEGGCWVEQNADGQWDVMVGHEVAETCRLKRDAQDVLLEYIR